MPEAQTAERDVSRSPPIARIAFDLRSSRCAASDPRQLRLGSAGHTLADLRKRVQNIVEVGGVEPACRVFGVAGQKVSGLVRANF